MRRGFSIAECLIAAVLLCGISVCLFGVWAMHARASTGGRETLVATYWAEQIMEEKLSQGYTVKEDTGANPPFMAKQIVNDNLVETAFYYRTYVTDPVSTEPNPGLKVVSVEVAWENGGKWKSIRLVTRLGWQG